MPRIYIAHRQANEFVTRMVAVLKEAYGDANIVTDARQDHEILLVVIGARWATLPDTNGNPLIFGANDPVRKAIERGLQHEHILIVPILREDATMPTEQQLPQSIQAFAEYSTLQIRDEPDFRRDTQRLIFYINSYDQAGDVRKSRTPQIACGVALFIIAVTIAAIIAVTLLAPPQNTDETPRPEAPTADLTSTASTPEPTPIDMPTEAPESNPEPDTE